MIRAAAEKVVKLFKPTPAAMLAAELAKAEARAAEALAKFVAEPTDANGDACEAARKTAERLRWRHDDAARREREAEAEAERQQREAERAAIVAEFNARKEYVNHGYRTDPRVAELAQRAADALAMLDDVAAGLSAINHERSEARATMVRLAPMMTLDQLGMSAQFAGIRERAEAMNLEHEQATRDLSSMERERLSPPYADPTAHAETTVRHMFVQSMQGHFDVTDELATKCREQAAQIFRTRPQPRYPNTRNELIEKLAHRPHR